MTDHTSHAAPRRAHGVQLRALFVTVMFLFVSTIAAHQSTATRDHLTKEEVDLVRDEQRLDRRTELFVKAIERRLSLLADAGAPSAKRQKAIEDDAAKSGTLAGTPAELIGDIARILDEAVTNIDDASDRNKQKEMLPKALRKLADASERTVKQLTIMRENADRPTRLALEQAIENAQAVVDAAAERLPATATDKSGE